jgi:transposase
VRLPGGAKQKLTAAQAKVLLASVRPGDRVGKIRRTLVADRIVDLIPTSVR